MSLTFDYRCLAEELVHKSVEKVLRYVGPVDDTQPPYTGDINIIHYVRFQTFTYALGICC